VRLSASPVILVVLLAALSALGLLGSAAAQDQPSVLGGRDTDQPIEITADSLEVQQDQRVATFSGNVDAVQGDLVLNADTLRVHYAQEGGSNPSGIRRIEASGNVLLSSPQETAQGDEGVYFVDRDFIELTGNVVLTRGDNVIRGRQLELDLASGHSRIVGASTAAEGAAPQDRVRALFYPESQGEGQEDAQ
jgi:lipopolysaccharide export system protein LptA